MKKALFLIVVICTLILPGISLGEVVVDTGTPTSEQAWSLVGPNIMGDPVWLSSRFSVNYPGYEITDVLGYIGPGWESKNLLIQIRGYGGEAPSDTVLCSGTFYVTGGQEGGVSGWYGLNGMTDCDLDPGEYWVVFGSDSQDLAGMPFPSPNPLSAGAVSNDYGVHWIEKDDLCLGIRINGIPFSAPSEPDIEVSPLEHHFGDVNVGSASPIMITISNVGSESLNVDNIVFDAGSSSDFVMSSPPAFPVNIPTANSLDIEITFSPSDVGQSAATLEIHSDDPINDVIYVTLSGVGIEALPQYEIAFCHVQRRTYEDDREFNHLGFAMRSLDGDIPESDIVQSVILYDNNNQEVELTSFDFQYYRSGYGQYDEEAGEWVYPDLNDQNYYSYEIQDALVPDTLYRLVVTDIYDVVHERFYQFNVPVELPIISADTINWFTDEFRNLVLNWEIPIDPPANTSVMAIIKIFNDDQFIGDFGMRVPTDLGYLPLPPWVLQMLQNFGNSLGFVVQLRTNDNNFRTYSRRILLPPHYIGNWYAQHRLYEDGRDFNRLYFSLNDIFANRISVETALNPDPPVLLFDEINNSLTLENGRFWAQNVAYGFYDGTTGNFNDFHYEVNYLAEITAQLAPGRYKLSITDRNNETLEGFYRFNGDVSLPIIPANTFQTRFEDGHFSWQWQPLEPLPYDWSFRATISLFNGENYVGEHYITVPPDLNQLIMPESFLNYGDRLKLRIELRTNDNNSRTYSNLLTIPRIDTDQDGISDNIDTDPDVFSRIFSDGSTFGMTIPADQTLAITDVPDLNGVLISVSGGTTPAQFRTCDDDAGQFLLDAGEEILVTCGSVTVKAISGIVQVTFKATDGTIATADVGAGNELSFDPATFEITAPHTNVDTVIVELDGVELTIEPGASKILVEIDIKPGSETNCFNQNEHSVLPVAIFGSPLLNVEDINIESLSFQGLSVKVAGKTNKLLAHIEYVNSDSYPDLIVQFEDSDSWVDIGSGNAFINGNMLDGKSIEGSDIICIIE